MRYTFCNINESDEIKQQAAGILILLTEIEKRAKKKGIIGLIAGSDDEENSTSLSEKEITGENIFEEIKNIHLSFIKNVIAVLLE